jgi:hypothetical protein
MNSAVDRATRITRKKYSDPLCIVDIARSAFRYQTRAKGFEQRPMLAESPCADSTMAGSVTLPDGLRGRTRTRGRLPHADRAAVARRRSGHVAPDLPILVALPELKSALEEPARLVRSTV